MYYVACNVMDVIQQSLLFVLWFVIGGFHFDLALVKLHTNCNIALCHVISYGCRQLHIQSLKNVKRGRGDQWCL